jgi:hypothetical protein
LATLGIEFTRESKIGQGIDILITDQKHTATVAAVSPIGTTEGNIFLAPKTHATVTALAGFNANRGFIYKFHDVTLMEYQIDKQ